MTSHTYTCAVCGGTFTSARPDDEAKAEARTLFPEMHGQPHAEICDTCFKAFMRWHKDHQS